MLHVGHVSPGRNALEKFSLLCQEFPHLDERLGPETLDAEGIPRQRLWLQREGFFIDWMTSLGGWGSLGVCIFYTG